MGRRPKGVPATMAEAIERIREDLDLMVETELITGEEAKEAYAGYLKVAPAEAKSQIEQARARLGE